MKTAPNIKPVLILILFLMIGTGSLSALEPSATCAEKMHEKLKENIKYPSTDSRFSLEGEVQVIFTINDQGKVDICNIFGTDPELVRYVKEKLPTLQCKDFKEAYNKYFKVKFSFQLI